MMYELDSEFVEQLILTQNDLIIDLKDSIIKFNELYLKELIKIRIYNNFIFGILTVILVLTVFIMISIFLSKYNK